MAHSSDAPQITNEDRATMSKTRAASVLVAIFICGILVDRYLLGEWKPVGDGKNVVHTRTGEFRSSEPPKIPKIISPKEIYQKERMRLLSLRSSEKSLLVSLNTCNTDLARYGKWVREERGTTDSQLKYAAQVARARHEQEWFLLTNELEDIRANIEIQRAKVEASRPKL